MTIKREAASAEPTASPDFSPAAPTTIPMPKLGVRGRWILLRGKLRRFYYGHFRQDYIAAQALKREGECIRCGACCEILFKCPFASECDEGSTCKIYEKRPVNCRVFPMDKHDLEEIHLMRPDRPCSYSFKD